MTNRPPWLWIIGLCPIGLLAGSVSAATVTFDKTKYDVADSAIAKVAGAAAGTLITVRITT
jgi:hypothetical protein